MEKTQEAMIRIIGRSPAWFRPPYGSYNDLVLQAAAHYNMSTVLWDFDSGDSINATVDQSEKNYTDIVKKNHSNILALNHETYNTTACVCLLSVIPFPLIKSKTLLFSLFCSMLFSMNAFRVS